MKRVLADLFFLASVCSATVLALIILILCLGIPNSIGLDRRPILSAGAAAIRHLARNEDLLLWCGVVLLIAVPIAFSIKLIAQSSQSPGRSSSAEFSAPAHDSITVEAVFH